MIEIKNLNKSYQIGEKHLKVLVDVSLFIQRGELVSIIGKSGSGKSTLLNMIGMLDNYDSGEYWFDKNLINNVSESDAAHYRNKYIGFVFQTFHLIGTKSALDNVALPLMYKGIGKKERSIAAEKMPATVQHPLYVSGWPEQSARPSPASPSPVQNTAYPWADAMSAYTI